ncbi:MAG: AAA family ATPase [Luteitalea sp.]|nr:AAA family ATPase [Luteitalea sp.]
MARTGGSPARGTTSLTGGVVAVDPATLAIFGRATRVAAANCSVLITGETGTGKEVVAKFIHRSGPRRSHPFVPVNCGALPETLIESELFGYRQGAFTGAVRDKKGYAEEAHRGVLFLDEVGEIPPVSQARLLRFLESGEVPRLGDARPRWVDVAVIAATNCDLQRDVDRGRFRQDLLYRLRGVLLHVPPLRDRPRDIPALVMDCLRQCAVRSGQPVRSLSDDAWTWLQEYQWPGNVRELKHMVGGAVAMSTGEVITRLDLVEAVGIPQSSRAQFLSTVARDEEARRRLLEVLERFSGNRTRAARALGISRTTFWRRLRQPRARIT